MNLRHSVVSAAIFAGMQISGAAEFSFQKMREAARELAAKPHVPPSDKLDDFWKNLSYDGHREIRFKMESGLWYGKNRPFTIDFFHPGWTAKEMVEIHEVHGAEENKLTFDPTLFEYGKSKPPAGVLPPPGYAGWRARCHLNSSTHMDEFLVFLGASYFRAIPKDAPYGLSARGISINSGLPGVPEEFPAFTKFYLKRPAENDSTLATWAMLEGPSVTGAYQFIITPGVETVMDVQAEITLRKPVKQLGLAPFSSMFWFGEGTHPRPIDFRPEVHDSDGLLMELGSGNLHFRPLETSRRSFRHCVFALEQPRSWALVQRDRSLHSYEDMEAGYHDRPGVKVEPISGMEFGKLHLIEMPTHDETGDNVVLIWEPRDVPEVGKPFRFHYRLKWVRDLPPSPVFAVRATRVGTPVQKPDELLIAVDFAKPLYPVKKTGDPKWDDVKMFKPVVTINQQKAKLIHAGLADMSMANVDALPAGIGRSDLLHMPQVLRAFFVIDPKGAEQLDMTCELQDRKGKAVSERWTYLWSKP
ncbi:MAG: glucan biosynthesis protein [Verrucomicrobiota bacterium]